MHLLIVGGSSEELGGVEAFIDRAKQALETRTDHHIDRIIAHTAYLNIRRLPAFISGLRDLVLQGRKKPNCVWIQYVNIFDLAYVAVAKSLGLRVLVTPHLGTNWKSQQNMTLKNISAHFLSFADRLALISKTQEKELELPNAVPKFYIRNFLPSTVWASSVPDREDDGVFHIFHAGRLSEGKGTFLFVEMCKRLRSENIPFTAKISGGASAQVYDQLRSMIAAYGLQESVTLLGRIPDDALLQLMRTSNVLVHLSKIDSYPLVVLESIAHGAFPICLDLAGARDMVDTYTGHIVSHCNPIEEAVAFLKTRTPADLQHAGSDASRRLRDDYSWDRCASAVDAAISGFDDCGRKAPA